MAGFYTDGLPEVTSLTGDERFPFDTTRTGGSPPQSAIVTFSELVTIISAQITGGGGDFIITDDGIFVTTDGGDRLILG